MYIIAYTAFSNNITVSYNPDDELITFSFPEELKVCFLFKYSIA